MKIITDPKRLAMPCESINLKDSHKIAKRMKLFMLNNKNVSDKSIGLACNQLGLPGRVIMIKIKGRWVTFINPTIESKSDETVITKESCLSVPKKSVYVERSKSISLMSYQYKKRISPKSFDLWASIISEFDDYSALVAQHEIDHLDGITIIERESPKV